ncbi:hypothetical protein E1211_17945 [Micromonospora sp. 15K316]|uniref:hypothetical protein n=1 Tax=Micromonospora sp. 15K316 TaxID=2530376 RepID=UPI001049A739|nr:hypothetical protein [Micromonospora sp. 15K316]TDC34229.1 hypothetical protein E1211_17945 [Micromonospora sp. 15K316]
MTSPVDTASTAARFELGGSLDAYRVQVRDRAMGKVVLVCHPYTAARWLAWYAAGPGGGHRSWVEDNDLRVCVCQHLCMSHVSTLPDYSQAPGLGNGSCGVGGCGCVRFVPLVAAPGGLLACG